MGGIENQPITVPDLIMAGMLLAWILTLAWLADREEAKKK